jgi:hypothetical protein
MKVDEDRKRGKITCSVTGWNPMIHIPSVQWFGVKLDTGSQYLGDTEVVCKLFGTLCRELC